MILWIFVLLSVSIVSADDEKSNKLVKANNRFAPDVYKQLTKKEPGNIIMSPYSAEIILALLRVGCKGDTATELSKALYLSDDNEQIESDAKSLLISTRDNKSSTLQVANGLFIQEGFEIKDSFTKVAEESFLAVLKNLNFAESKKATDTINDWVEDKTNNTIRDLLGPNDVDASTVLVMVNAVHFKSNWTIPFPQTNTQMKDFYKTSTNIIQVETLHNQKSYEYYDSETLKAQFLKLAFKDGKASLIVALPKDKDGLQDLEGQINEVFITSLPFQSTMVNVALPKFKFETKIDFEAILKCLCVNKIFTSGDLSGIAGKKGDLTVSKILQKAFIDLNEGGVEAAAATAIGISRLARPIALEPPTDFIADHPFIFFILYDDAIIFAGRVTEPKY